MKNMVYNDVLRDDDMASRNSSIRILRSFRVWRSKNIPF